MSTRASRLAIATTSRCSQMWMPRKNGSKKTIPKAGGPSMRFLSEPQRLSHDLIALAPSLRFTDASCAAEVERKNQQSCCSFRSNQITSVSNAKSASAARQRAPLTVTVQAPNIPLDFVGTGSELHPVPNGGENGCKREIGANSR